MLMRFDPNLPIHTYAWIIDSPASFGKHPEIGAVILSCHQQWFRVLFARIDVVPSAAPWIKPMGGATRGEGDKVIAFMPFNGLEQFEGQSLHDTAFAHPLPCQRVDGEHWAVYACRTGKLCCDAGEVRFLPQTAPDTRDYEFTPYALSGHALEPDQFIHLVPHSSDLVCSHDAQEAAMTFIAGMADESRSTVHTFINGIMKGKENA